MGPWVDPLILRKCLEYQVTLGMRRDQEAIPTLLAQYAELIGDRTVYLHSLERGEALRNPAVNAARVARMLVAGGARVLGVPCNTFHAGPIFSRFEAELADLTTRPEPVLIVNMIQAAIAEVLTANPQIRRIGIVSSNGTYLDRIYSAPIAARGLDPLTLPYEPRLFPDDEQEARKEAILQGQMEPSQNDVHHAIVHTGWGIKSGREAVAGYPTAKAILRAAARTLAEQGAAIVILGCTEFPIAIGGDDVPDVPLCDPMDSLARALVDGYRRLASCQNASISSSDASERDLPASVSLRST